MAPKGLGGDHVAEADAGRQHLGEGSHIDGALRRQRTNRGRRVAGIGQFAVRVILKDQQIKLTRFLGEAVATPRPAADPSGSENSAGSTGTWPRAAIRPSLPALHRLHRKQSTRTSVRTARRLATRRDRSAFRPARYRPDRSATLASRSSPCCEPDTIST